MDYATLLELEAVWDEIEHNLSSIWNPSLSYELEVITEIEQTLSAINWGVPFTDDHVITSKLPNKSMISKLPHNKSTISDYHVTNISCMLSDRNPTDVVHRIPNFDFSVYNTKNPCNSVTVY